MATKNQMALDDISYMAWKGKTFNHILSNILLEIESYCMKFDKDMSEESTLALAYTVNRVHDQLILLNDRMLSEFIAIEELSDEELRIEQTEKESDVVRS